jgi:DNA-binding PadR family transcriptional regulator
MSLPTRAVVQSILDFDGFECVLTDENHVYSIKYQLELLQKGEKLDVLTLRRLEREGYIRTRANEGPDGQEELMFARLSDKGRQLIDRK